MTAESPGGLAVFSAEESECGLSGTLAGSSRVAFSLIRGSAFKADAGASCFSVILSPGSASLESRKEERRRLTALVRRDAMSENDPVNARSTERVTYANMNRMKG